MTILIWLLNRDTYASCFSKVVEYLLSAEKNNELCPLRESCPPNEMKFLIKLLKTPCAEKNSYNHLEIVIPLSPSNLGHILKPTSTFMGSQLKLLQRKIERSSFNYFEK